MTMKTDTIAAIRAAAEQQIKIEQRVAAEVMKAATGAYEMARRGKEILRILDAAEKRAEAAVDDLNRDGTCDTCKRGPDNHKCGKCGVGCYEWRGPEPGKEPSEC
jgi:hypothetical protein